MLILDGTTGCPVTTVTGTLPVANGGTGVTTAIDYGFKNRIINGAMVIDQRNAGASITPANSTYALDRWKFYQTTASKFSVQQTPSATETGYATRVAAGFTNYLAATSLSAYSVSSSDYYTIQQPIEAFNTADLAWGTANAKSVTLSFWVRSSLTGTFGGSIFNAAGDRSYPFTYTVNSANTWEYETITIAGDTSGNWGTTNGISLQICISLGAGSTYSGTAGAWASTLYTSVTGATSVVGTNGATFYITGVQLEKGSTATSFDYRPYGTELALCQRYYQTGGLAMAGYQTTGSSVGGLSPFAVTMRATPTVVFTDTLNTNTAAGTSQANTFPSAYAAGGETTVSATGGYRFARTFTASIEL